MQVKLRELLPFPEKFVYKMNDNNKFLELESKKGEKTDG